MDKSRHVTVNQIVFSDKETRKKILEHAIEISKNGGAYSFRDCFNGSTWMTEITIYWPEK